MADLPFSPPDPFRVPLAAALDRERKLDRALDALGPVAAQEVVLIGGGPRETAHWRGTGAQVTLVDSLLDPAGALLPGASADMILSSWTAFRGVDPAELAAADRVLRPAGRLLIVHDYGRDDVSGLRGDLPEYGAWSRRNGPFLANGFRVRVVHCFWTFDSIEDAQALLAGAFGDAGVAFGRDLKRPRLSWNVAIYHRTRGGEAGDATAFDPGCAAAT